jgi:hypothetical protein
MKARKLSRRSQNRLKRIKDSLEKTALLVNQVSLEELEELIRRDAIGIAPNGFPPSSALDGGSGSKGWGPESTSSTVAAVMALQTPVNDELAKRLRKIEANIFTAEKALRELDRSVRYIFDKVDSARGRVEQSSPCAICLIAPVKKANWCIDDYAKWEEAGRPDRLLWTMYMRQDRNSEGILMVPDPPEPTVELKT